jgi:hypothetical protein
LDSQDTASTTEHESTYIMGLVDYSDSEPSDIEEVSVAKPAAPSSKPAFQKVVDRANPGKIKVSLPQASLKDDTTSDEPPTKRAKTGGGAFSGFNSFLPAPKRTGQTAASLGGGTAAKKGLGPGVNLKTGAAPGFSREPEPERYYTEEEENEPAPTNVESGMSLPPPKSSQNGEQQPAGEVKLVGKPLMFKPLSVSRKPAKKKAAVPAVTTLTSSASMETPVTPQSKIEKAAPRPKVSLFSMSTESTSISVPASTGEYQPMMTETKDEAEEDEADSLEPSYEDYTPNTSFSVPPAVPTPPVSQSLDDIAGDLKLSAAERRQLFGRQKGGRATTIKNFNTDQEYLHNEELRAAGEQAVHNPVRAIAPGKHSLKQLVNAAQSQKEALEESFAKGKSNRAEASSRYGW